MLNDDVKRAKYIEELWTEETGVAPVGDKDVKFAFLGTAADGRKIYKTNYPLNTPKAVKRQDIIDLVQNVWHLKPIKLTIIEDGNPKQITVKFNPILTPRSDLSKIAFGNRKGTGSEQRITLNLSSDLYQIAQDATYVKSKKETGKDNPAHDNVSEWHYFVTNLVYVEDDGTSIDCYMNIDVKENADGDWFYSFAIEKGTAPQTLLAAVTDKSATVPNGSISDNEPSVNTSDEKKSLAKVDDGDSADRLEKLNSDSGVKFSKAKVEKTDEYTEEQYDSFGWVRDNDILNSAQYGDFTSKFADAVSGNVKFNKTKNGEFIIPVSDISEPDTEGVNRFLVFAKGKIDKPVISSIIEIYEYDETTLDKTRRNIYASERRGIQPKIGETFIRFNSSDFGAYEYKGRLSQNNRDSRDNGRPGRNTSEAAGSEKGTGQQGEVKYSNSIPDSSDTAYIPKGEKPKSSTASIAALAKRNAVLNKRLADAKKCISCIGFVFFADKNIMTK